MLDRLGLPLAILFVLANTAGILFYTEKSKNTPPQIAMVDMQKIALSLVKIEPIQDEKMLNQALMGMRRRVISILETESGRTGKIYVSATSALAGVPDETQEVLEKLQTTN